jgi:hypothetical protein
MMLICSIFFSLILIQADTIKLTHYTHHTYVTTHTHTTRKLDLQPIQHTKQLKVHRPQNAYLNLDVEQIRA